MTPHEYAIQRFMDQHPTASRIRFKRAMLQILMDDREPDEELIEYLGEHFHRVPDAWMLRDGGPGIVQVVLFESEHHNRLSESKIRDYIDLWWVFDASESYDLSLILGGRYGGSTEIDMVQFAYNELRQEASR